MTQLVDVASVIRSKNAGPYELTLDVVFKERRWYDHVVQTNLLDVATISRLYCVRAEEVVGVVNFSAANAIKITLRRPLVSGAVGDTDIYGAQQHAPLLSLILTEAADG